MTAYNRIFDEAIENYGLITTSKARELGIPPGILVDLAYRGRLTRIGQGVYQLVQYAPDIKDPYAQAVALVGEVPNCDEAVAWANDLIKSINKA